MLNCSCCVTLESASCSLQVILYTPHCALEIAHKELQWHSYVAPSVVLLRFLLACRGADASVPSLRPLIAPGLPLQRAPLVGRSTGAV